MKYGIALVAIALLVVAVVAVLWVDPQPKKDFSEDFKSKKRPGVASAGGIDSVAVGGSVSPVPVAPKVGQTEFESLNLEGLPTKVSGAGIYENLPPVGDVPHPEPRGDVAVVGVSVGEQSAAYPLAFFNVQDRLVINDTLEGEPIAVSFDPASGTAVAFRRSVGGLNLRFEPITVGWDGSRLFRDDKTETLWSNLTPWGLKGQLKGTALEWLPVTLTTWSQWKQAQPRSRWAYRPLDIEESWSESPAARQFPWLVSDASTVGVAVLTAEGSWWLPRGDAAAAEPLRYLSPEESGTPSIVAVWDSALPILAAHRLPAQTATGSEPGWQWNQGKLQRAGDSVIFVAGSGRPLGGESSTSLTPLPILLVPQATWLRFHPKAVVVPR